MFLINCLILKALENALSKDPKMSLSFITGYIVKKYDDSRDDVLLNDTNFYQQKYADFV